MPYYIKDPKGDHNFDNHPYSLFKGYRNFWALRLSGEPRVPQNQQLESVPDEQRGLGVLGFRGFMVLGFRALED